MFLEPSSCIFRRKKSPIPTIGELSRYSVVVENVAIVLTPSMRKLSWTHSYIVDTSYLLQMLPILQTQRAERWTAVRLSLIR